MFYLYAVLLILLNFCWLLLNLVGMPGNWLIVITTAIVMWAQSGTEGRMFSVTTLVALTALAALGEVLEFAAGAVGASQAGGTRRGSIGALVGGIAGAIVGTMLIPVPVIGSIIGACGGAFGGALIMEFSGGRSLDESLRSGIGAGKGRLVGTLVKIGVGAVMWLLAAVAVFWP
jgi:uncharacterized protein YqgC (DUF456 family)